MISPSPERVCSQSFSEKFDDGKLELSLESQTLSYDRGSEEVLPSTGSNGQDEALDLLSAEGRPLHLATASEDALLVRKIDRNIMPIITCIYFLQYLDKQTLAFTSVFGLSSEANLTGDDYSLLGSIVFIAQLAMQPLSAYFLVRFRLSIYVPFVVTAWGISLACSGAARNFLGLLFGRLFLGVFEASIQAAFVLVVQIWYRRHEHGFRLACFYSMYGWTNIIGPLLVFGIGHIKSNAVYSYQIVYIVLGGITFLVGLIAFMIFPDNAVRCRFLTTEEKVMAIERLRANQQGLETKSFKIKQVVETISDIKTWCWIALAFVASTASGGWSTFAPLVLQSFGYSRVMLLMIPYGVVTVTVIWTGFWLNRRFSIKSGILLVALIPCISALVILLKVGRSSDDRPLLLFAYYLMPTIQLVNSTLINWQTSNVAGHTKKTVTTAAMLMGSFAGNIVGPLLFSTKDRPYYHRGIIAMLICYITCAIFALFTIAYLAYLNKVNQGRRIAKGKAACIVDYSMLSVANAEKQHLTANSTTGIVETGSSAFDDLTDLENEEFIYVY